MTHRLPELAMRNWIVGCAAVLASAGVGHGLLAPAAGSTDAPCCYVNTQYAGVCSVVPAQGETCVSILAYLNNPRSQGKSYCRSTSVRAGWQRRKCSVPTAGRAAGP